MTQKGLRITQPKIRKLYEIMSDGRPHKFKELMAYTGIISGQSLIVSINKLRQYIKEYDLIILYVKVNNLTGHHYMMTKKLVKPPRLLVQ